MQMPQSRTVNTIFMVIGVIALILPELQGALDLFDDPAADRWIQFIGGLLLLIARLEVILGVDINQDGRIGPVALVLPFVLVVGLLLSCGSPQEPTDGVAVPTTSEERPFKGPQFRLTSLQSLGAYCLNGEANWSPDEGVSGDWGSEGAGRFRVEAEVHFLGFRAPLAAELVLDHSADAPDHIVACWDALDGAAGSCHAITESSDDDVP